MCISLYATFKLFSKSMYVYIFTKNENEQNFGKAMKWFWWQMCNARVHSLHASHSNNDYEDSEMLCNHSKGY